MSWRRFIVALAVVYAGALPVGATDPSAVDAALARLTLRQKLAQLLIVRFTGPTYSADVETMMARQGAGAVILYSRDNNIVDAAQLTALTTALRNSGPVPPMIGVDQEGGRVDRLTPVRGARPAATAIAARADASVAARAEGTTDARDLARFGFDLNLAPVVDITQVYNWQLDQRTYGWTADAVTNLAGEYLAGLQSGGRVVGTLKHFPGLGGVTEDPHRAVPRLSAPRTALEAFDWVPYRKLIQRGDVYAIMVTHVFLEAIDPVHPASLSHAIVTDVLRTGLGFNGVIVADALTMKGVASDESQDALVLRALLAGVDWFMGPSSARDVDAIVTRLERAVQDASLPVARVDASVRRVLELKQRVGLLDVRRP